MNGVLTMSSKERYRLKLLSQIQKSQMTYREAAEHLAVSERHIYRLLHRLQTEGDAGLIHRLRGKSSNRGHGPASRKHVIGLYRQQYGDYGPTLFAEQLLAAHGIVLDHETARCWLRAAGITHFERRRRKHRRKRERRSAIGQLVQFDGSPHDWFEGRCAPCCLLDAVDDASNRIFLRLVTEILDSLKLLIREETPHHVYSICDTVINDPRGGDGHWPRRGCSLSVKDMTDSGSTLTDRIWHWFEARGWVQVLPYSTDGPDGTMFGVFRDTTLCIVEGRWMEVMTLIPHMSPVPARRSPRSV